MDKKKVDSLLEHMNSIEHSEVEDRLAGNTRLYEVIERSSRKVLRDFKDNYQGGKLQEDF